MDDYVESVSETVGEDVSVLFAKFGTTLTHKTDLPPMAPRP
jgi:hypothetical protein